MASLSSTGAFTGLATDLTPYEDTQRPSVVALKMAGVDLQTPPDEIRQMIRIFQDGWGALLGSGKRLDYWVTVRMLELYLQTTKNDGIQRSGDRVGQ